MKPQNIVKKRHQRSFLLELPFYHKLSADPYLQNVDTQRQREYKKYIQPVQYIPANEYKVPS